VATIFVFFYAEPKCPSEPSEPYRSYLFFLKFASFEILPPEATVAKPATGCQMDKLDSAVVM